jgi:hypothetical protein
MKRALVIACAGGVALAACSDPGNRCPDGTVAPPGQMCTGPAIAIDGDFSDWDALPASTPTCDPCVAGEVTGLRVVRSADAALAILLATNGAPITNGTHAYSLFLYNVRSPIANLSVQIAPGSATIMTINEVVVDGLPSSYAYGPHEIEIAIPLVALPFAGAVTVGAQLDAYDGNMWSGAQAALPFSTICWDPTSPACAPY